MKNGTTEALAKLITKATGVPVVVEGWSEGLIIHADTAIDLASASSWMLGNLRLVDKAAHVDRVVDASGHAPKGERFFALVRVSWERVKSEAPAVVARLK